MTHTDPWALYDRLIASVSADAIIDEVISGPHWTMVRAGSRVGCAMTVSVDTVSPIRPNGFLGLSLKEAAACVKSWNLTEASVGMAAINAWYNNAEQETLFKQSGSYRVLPPDEDAFLAHLEQMRGKKVAVIGHFPRLDSIAQAAELSILERNPRTGDFPDSACEYLLPEQDFVFITGSTLVNKTLPRLLALSAHAYTVLVGPTVPLFPGLLEFGVNALHTSIVEDADACRAVIPTGGTGGMLKRFGHQAGLQAIRP